MAVPKAPPPMMPIVAMIWMFGRVSGTLLINIKQKIAPPPRFGALSPCP
jgi:hypothetical protein